MKKLINTIKEFWQIATLFAIIFSAVSTVAVSEWQRRLKLEKFAEVISGVVISNAKDVSHEWQTKTDGTEVIVILTNLGNVYGFSFGNIPEVYSVFPDYTFKDEPMMFNYKGDKVTLEKR